MTTAYFSPSLKSFIPAAWKDDGTYSETNWPYDAVLATAEEVDGFWKQTPPVGKLQGSVDGRPAWVDIPPPPPLSADELAATARRYRDAFIVATDPIMVSDYSIDDKPLTEVQRSELTTTRAIYRAWPTLANWPLIELPASPQWLLIEAVNQGYRVPVWPDASYVA
ncbi:phage tail protein [Yersinia sp. 1252 StPb PI]|uniref:phage tail protein n=1 Tax=Yersinia sp. 1252 StPb PI TaxID=3117404 RepID=UPI003B28A5FE